MQCAVYIHIIHCRKLFIYYETGGGGPHNTFPGPSRKLLWRQPGETDCGPGRSYYICIHTYTYYVLQGESVFQYMPSADHRGCTTVYYMGDGILPYTGISTFYLFLNVKYTENIEINRTYYYIEIIEYAKNIDNVCSRHRENT